jgi:hypothetical protein
MKSILINRNLSKDSTTMRSPHCCHAFTITSTAAVLGCMFLQETSGFLCFPFLWHFFHRNHDSCSAVTFSERHQETCLYGAYVESYIGYQFVRQKQSMIQFYGTLRWFFSTTITAPPPKQNNSRN